MRYAFIGSDIKRRDQPSRLLAEVLNLDAKAGKGEDVTRDWCWLMADIREHLGRPIGERL